MEKGAIVVKPPSEMSDENGTVRYCVIQTYGDTTHTLFDLSGFKGIYLPGYRATDSTGDPLTKLL
jgi:4-hydroxyphenylpyruvate dioxygenase